MDAALEREPLYRQIVALLRAAVEGHGSGDRFPSEREVAARYGVSRITANKALASLVAEGVLEHRRGVGNFVRPRVMGYDLRGLVSFTEKARQAGGTPTTDVLRFQRGPREGFDRADLGEIAPEPGEEVIEMVRLRRLDGRPVILERRWVRAASVPGLTTEDAAGSLYAAFAERFGLGLTGTRATLRAVNLDASDAARLDVAPNAAAFLIAAVGYAGAPLWVEETLYRGDAYEISHVLGGVVGTILVPNES